MWELPIRSPLGEGQHADAPVYYLEQTDSTMDDARRLVQRGVPSGTVVMTDYQRTGRGRRAGRSWHSPPRESLMFTLMLHRPAEPVTRSFVMAAAICRLLERTAGLYAEVKWPNDVLVGGRKVSGILADHENHWLYLGVGLNVHQTAFPEGLAAPATSIAIETMSGAARPDSGPCDRDQLLVGLLSSYLRCQADWHRRISQRLWMRGAQVSVSVPYGTPITGRLVGVAEDGCLLIDAGEVHRLAAGEVSLTRECHE